MNCCYILGAGFSKPFGFPLSTELTRTAWNTAYGPVQPHKAGDYAKSNYLQFLRWQFPKCDFVEQWPDFEELLTTLDEFERYRVAVTSLNESEKTGPFGHLHNTLLDAAVEHLYDCADTLSNKDNTVVAQFVKHVRRDQHTIISFNWDSLIEVVCHDMDLGVLYANQGNGGLKVIRPHGTINAAPVTRKDYSDRPQISTGSEIIWQCNEDVVVRASNPLMARNVVFYPVPKHKTTVVAPCTRKIYDSAWIREQWRMAHEAMANAHEVIVLGFSLPSSDLWPRALFQFNGVGQHCRRRIVLVAPDANELKSRYVGLGNWDIDPVAADWRDWFKTYGARVPHAVSGWGTDN